MSTLKPLLTRVSLVIATGLMFITTCGGQVTSARSALTLIPANSIAVARLDWRVVSRDSQLRRMLNADQLDRSLSQLALTSSEISEIVIFSGVNLTPSGTITGIFQGSYNPQKIAAKLHSQNLTEATYKGRTLYFNAADLSYLTILRSGMLAVGSEKGIRSVVDVEQNPALALHPRQPLRAFLSKLGASKPPITFAMGIPAEYRSVSKIATKVMAAMFSLAGLGPIGFVIDHVGFPDTLGFSIARRASDYAAVVLARMKDATAASLISGTLNLIQGINLAVLPGQMPSADVERLKSLSVSRTGSTLMIKLMLREQDLPK